MIKAAETLEFEDAAKLRDEINRLKAEQLGIKKLSFNKKNFS